MTWQDEAKCRDMDPALFFPERGIIARSGGDHDAGVTLAERLCRGCRVQEPCLRDALATAPYDDHGIRGGTTSKQRASLRRRVRAAA